MKYVIRNFRDLRKPESFMGVGVDESNAYLDVLSNFQSLDDSLAVAMRGNQLELNYVVDGESIPVEER